MKLNRRQEWVVGITLILSFALVVTLPVWKNDLYHYDTRFFLSTLSFPWFAAVILYWLLR